MLSPAQIAARESKITASFLPQLMAGDEPAIYAKWLELVGDPAWQPEDLSDNWPVYYGSISETPGLDWHERKTGQPLTRRGEVVAHPQRPFVCCTLDAYRAADDTVLDVKVVGAFRALVDVERYYAPQLVCQRACLGCRNAALLVIHGGAEPRELPIEVDADYEALVWDRVDAFQRCVETLTPPVPMPTVVPPDKWRTIDLDVERDAHNWASELIDSLFLWSTTERQAQDHESARTAIKRLLPADVGRVFCAGLTVARDRRNAISIRHKRAAA